MKVEHQIVLRDTQPHRYQALEDEGELTPINVMQSNMEFFHRRAAEVLAAIMAMPLGEDVNADQLQALKDLAGVIKLRELSQQCARDLARYTHPPLAPVPYKPNEAKEQPGGSAKVVDLIPVHPDVRAAFERAAAGLPPQPRKRL